MRVKSVFLCTLILVMSVLHPALRSQEVAEWTVMLYLNGDCDLEPDLIKNFMDLSRVGSSDHVHLVVQLDRILGHNESNGGWTDTKRFHVEKGMLPTAESAVQDMGEVNMGDPKQLRDFCQWSLTKYPAKRSILIIGSHGQGYRTSMMAKIMDIKMKRAFGLSNKKVVDLTPIERSALDGSREEFRAFAKDRPITEGIDMGVVNALVRDSAMPDAPVYRSSSRDVTSDDFLYNGEVKTALAGLKVDVLAFDACLMGMLEAAYEFREVASINIASEELIHGEGFKYRTWISALRARPDMTPIQLATEIVASYSEYAEDGFDDTTLSAINLSRIDHLAAKVSVLANVIADKITTEAPGVKRARERCAEYAPGSDRVTGKSAFRHIDLMRFCRELLKESRDDAIIVASQACVVEMESCIIANYRGESRAGNYGSHGLAVYFPQTKNDYTRDALSQGGYKKGMQPFPVTFLEDHTWSEFLMKYLKVNE